MKIENMSAQGAKISGLERDEVLVSIIIPTKNRHQQLEATLRANAPVGRLTGIEVLVADNSAEPMSAELQADLHALYPQFLYVHDRTPKSIMGNFNYGLDAARGKFIMFIGDDDFVLPEVIEAARYASDHTIDCVIYQPDRYYWKSCTFAKEGNIGPACLVLEAPRPARAVDTVAELARSARNGFLTIELLPRAYHGLVRTSVLRQLSPTQSASIVGGSPDISMAVSLALKNACTYFWPAPLSIYGASTGSGGGMTTSRTHLLPLHEATFLEADFIRSWDPAVPAYWSEYTVFPASAIYVHQALGFGRPAFSLASVYASILINEHEMALPAWRAFKSLDRAAKTAVLKNFPMALIRKSTGRFVRAMRSIEVLPVRSGPTIRKNVEHVDVLSSYPLSEYENSAPLN